MRWVPTGSASSRPARREDTRARRRARRRRGGGAESAADEAWDGEASSPFTLGMFGGGGGHGPATTAPTVACSSPPTQGRRGLDLQGSRHPVRPEGTRRPAGAVPRPRPLRVTLSEGAVIRSGVELSSGQIGRAPLGSVLTVVGKDASSKISKTGIASKLSTPSSDDEAKGGKAVRSPGICSNTRCYN
jgi:hypothetical protein